MSPLQAGALGGVFYVLPYYVTFTKLQQQIPNLMQDTWLLNLNQMPAQRAIVEPGPKCRSGKMLMRTKCV